MKLDWALFQALNGLAGRWPAFDRLIQFLMNDYALVTALSALMVVLWLRGRTPEEREADQKAAVYTIVALFIASAFVKGLNLLFFRLRPFTEHEVRVLFYYPSDSSLPSNSVMVAFVFAIGARQRSRELGALGIGMGVILGLARIIGGVHYPLDIITGALIGTGAVLAVFRCGRFLDPLVRALRALGRAAFLA